MSLPRPPANATPLSVCAQSVVSGVGPCPDPPRRARQPPTCDPSLSLRRSETVVERRKHSNRENGKKTGLLQTNGLRPGIAQEALRRATTPKQPHPYEIAFRLRLHGFLENYLLPYLDLLVQRGHPCMHRATTRKRVPVRRRPTLGPKHSPAKGGAPRKNEAKGRL